MIKRLTLIVSIAKEQRLRVIEVSDKKNLSHVTIYYKFCH